MLFLEKLKKEEKKQIKITMDKGRNMLGVIDETGKLEYGQVYVQYTCMESKQLRTLTGVKYKQLKYIFLLLLYYKR